MQREAHNSGDDCCGSRVGGWQYCWFGNWWPALASSLKIPRYVCDGLSFWRVPVLSPVPHHCHHQCHFLRPSCSLPSGDSASRSRSFSLFHNPFLANQTIRPRWRLHGLDTRTPLLLPLVVLPPPKMRLGHNLCLLCAQVLFALPPSPPTRSFSSFVDIILMEIFPVLCESCELTHIQSPSPLPDSPCLFFGSPCRAESCCHPSAARPVGGFSLDTADVGGMLMAGGASCVLFQMLLFPFLVKLLGLFRAFLLPCLVVALLTALFPFFSPLAVCGGIVALCTPTTLQLNPPRTPRTPLGLIQRVMFGLFVYISSLVATGRQRQVDWRNDGGAGVSASGFDNDLHRHLHAAQQLRLR